MAACKAETQRRQEADKAGARRVSGTSKWGNHQRELNHNVAACPAQNVNKLLWLSSVRAISRTIRLS